MHTHKHCMVYMWLAHTAVELFQQKNNRKRYGNCWASATNITLTSVENGLLNAWINTLTIFNVHSTHIEHLTGPIIILLCVDGNFVYCIKVENLYNMMYAINYSQWNMLVKSCLKLFEKKSTPPTSIHFGISKYMFINELACDVNIWVCLNRRIIIISYNYLLFHVNAWMNLLQLNASSLNVVFAKRFHLYIIAIHTPCDFIHFSFYDVIFVICSDFPSSFFVLIGFWCNFMYDSISLRKREKDKNAFHHVIKRNSYESMCVIQFLLSFFSYFSFLSSVSYVVIILLNDCVRGPVYY